MLHARLDEGRRPLRTFVLHLQSAARYDRVEGVASFVGQDESGSFGIQAGHGRLIATLAYGLARYRGETGGWTYLAMPGAVLYFVAGELFVTTRRYFTDTDYQAISTALVEKLLAEETELRGIKENLSRLEQEMVRRLWQMERSG